MAEVKWIKIVTDIFDNRKIRQIEKMPEGDAIVVIWFKLICLAGEVNDNGMIYITKEVPYTPEMLSTHFNRQLNIINLALQTFQAFNMIEIIDDIVFISNWEKYQNTDALEKIREQTRNRVAKYKQKQKELGGNVTVTLAVTQGNATDKSKNKNREDITGVVGGEPQHTFKPPMIDEVTAYCKERKNDVNAQKFIDFYQSKGWLVGKAKMKDWKAAVRNWERNTEQKPVRMMTYDD